MERFPLSQHPQLLRQTVTAIGKSAYGKALSSSLLNAVFSQAALVRLEPGELLIRQGEAANMMLYLLVSGECQVFADGKFVLQISEPGMTLGEMALINPKALRSADVRAQGAASLVAIQADFLNAADVDGLQLANRFLRLFSGILAEKLDLTTHRAKLYEDAVLETQETARYAQELLSSSEELKTELQDKLAQIKLYSQVVESSRDAIVTCDAQGNIQSCNQAFCEVFGFRRAEVMQRNLEQFFNDFKEDAAQLLSGVKAGWSGHRSAQPKQGASFPAMLSINPVKEADDPARVVYAVNIRDMTLQKEYEANLIQANNELKQTYVELERTLKELEKSNEAKDRFFSNITGQIKTPLVSLVNAVELLQTELKGSPVTKVVGKYLHSMLQDARKMETMVGNLVSMAQLNPELASLQFQPMSLERFLGQVEKRLGQNPRIKWDSHNQVKELVVDQDKFLAAFCDVLEFALRFKDETSLVHVQFTYAQNRQFLEIKISIGEVAVPLPSVESVDGGLAHGIETALQEAELNLPLAKRIIELHKGEVRLHSHEHSGNVEIRLPADPASDFSALVKVAIIDDQAWDRKLLKGIVQRQFPLAEVFEFKSQVDSLNALAALAPHLVILDPFFKQGQWAYDAFLQKIKANAEEASILVISNQLADLEQRQKVLSLGVTDFTFKPYTIQDASFKIKSIIDTRQRFRLLSNNMEKAEKTAITDGLTGLYNRRYYDQFIAEQINKAELAGQSLVVIMVDVDNFKHYNDTNGHQMGDLVLTKVAKILQKGVRKNDLAARYGGEEFVLVLLGASLVIGKKVAETLRKAIEETPFPKGNTQPLRKVTASFGVAVFPEHGAEAGALLKQADQCLYVAKEQGRNQVVLAGDLGGG